MAITMQLLKQLRRATAEVNRTATDPAHRMQLTAMDAVLNELMLQESPDFYLDYIAAGRTLLHEGRTLAAHAGTPAEEIAPARSALSAELRAEVLNDEIAALHRNLGAVIDVLDEARSAVARDWLDRVGAWDITLYHHRLEQPWVEVATGVRITPETLQAYLARRFPDWRDVKVLQFAPLDGGFSKKTIFFETEDALNGRQSLVMRAEQALDILGYDGSDVTREYGMIRYMRAQGLPVAEPLWLEADRQQLGTRFIVSRRAVGRTYGGNFGAEEPVSPALLDDLLANFIRLHNVRVDWSDPLVQASHLKEWEHCATVSDAVRYQITTFLQKVVQRNDLTVPPQLRRGLKWLRDNVPDCSEPPAIVHIDYAFNNLIIDGDRVTAILDWESSRIGDPAEDIIWTQSRLDTVIPMDEFLRRYRDGTGREISPYRIAYARVAKCALNALSCLGCMRGLDRHDETQINASVLGYRYMALFGSQFNELIAAAEAARG